MTSLTYAANHTVVMKSLSYEPKTIEVRVGDTIQWTNKAQTKHSATFKDHSELNTKLVLPGSSSAKIPFAKAGTYPYECDVHGSAMSGEVVVK